LEDAQLDRGDDGTLRYGWKRNTSPMGLDQQRKLVKAGHLSREEGRPRLCDVETGKPILAHRGTVYWNAHRRRWVMIATETFGTSMLGEVWYAEADTLEGPWAYARKIVTHDKYSFYNPKQHPMFDKEGGRIIFFEGTYTNTFSGNPDQTPRYNYNQVMYKLDLADPRLVLPVAVYRLSEEEGADRFATAERFDRSRPRPVPFFACDREGEGTIPIYERQMRVGKRLLRRDLGVTALTDAEPEPLFYALPADMKDPPAASVPLYEYVHQDGVNRHYLPGGSPSPPDCRRVEPAICRVWPDPNVAEGSESADR
jgi:hypothetical protein